jgi:hypothetical protein
VADAALLLVSDEADDRGEGAEVMRDALDSCKSRSGELKSMVGRLRGQVEKT